MPPRLHSRHSFTIAVRDADDTVLLTDPEPFTYRDLPDNRIHRVAEGDTLWSIANQYFSGLPRPAGLYWIVMDFQPTPIHDPTVKLPLGEVLVIPSVRTVLEEVFGEDRREE